MVIALRKRLKAYFTRGASPTEQQFSELIDSCLILGEDGIQISSQGEVEISSRVKIAGDLIVDGTFWLSESQSYTQTDNTLYPSNPLLSRQNEVPLSLPTGAILLWYGSELPNGFQRCDGKQGRPKLEAPVPTNAESSSPEQALNSMSYIINWG